MNDQERDRNPRPLIWIAILLSAATLVGGLLAGLWWWRRQRLDAARAAVQPIPPVPVDGLTEAEAEARRLEGQDNVVLLKPPRSRRDMVRENLTSIFNLSLLGLAFAQLLLGRPLDALLSAGTILLNVVLNVGQELFARKRIEDVLHSTRPQATVVREARVRSIDPSEIVVGDVLLAGPGDQLLVDGEMIGEGQLVVDESMLTGKTTMLTKSSGDQVYAGTFCASGHAAYRAQAVGDDRLIAQHLKATPAAKAELTPLQRVIDRILKILLAIVTVFTIVLLVTYFRVDFGIPSDAVNSAISVIYSIAPASLFFMIILNYAGGTADLAKLGAVVHRAQSVESLAQSTVICFAKAGILTGTHVAIEPIESVDEEQLPESRIRQILGSFARSSSLDSLATKALIRTFEGSQRPILDEAPFLSVYGWAAIVVDDPDFRGTYVLGDPEVLEAHFGGEDGETEEEQDGSRLPDLRKVFSPVGRFFRRGESEDEHEETGTDGPNSEPVEPASQAETVLASVESASQVETVLAPVEPASQAETALVSGEPAPVEDDTGLSSADEEEPEDSRLVRMGRGIGGIFGSVRNQVGRLTRRGEEVEEVDEASEEEPEPEIVLFCAYTPELTVLHDEEWVPHLPQTLIPVCMLRFTERVRPDAFEAVQTFTESGVDVKVFTPDSPERTVDLLKQAGMDKLQDKPLSGISGNELEGLPEDELEQAVAETSVFGTVTAEQAGSLVRHLRGADESVAVVGDAMSDLAAMRQANLAITMQSSTQAALSVADIVLLEDSPSVLSGVLNKGQRIVNGLMDILKLQLSQVFYLALLIVAIQVLAFGFPYSSMQGTMIVIVSIVLPSMGLSFWAAAGVLPTRLTRILLHFVAPAAITMSAVGLITYLHFLQQTGDLAYTQLAVTWALVATGLGLVLLTSPPIHVSWRFSVRRGDLRPTILVVIVFVLFYLVTAIPLAQEYLDVGRLHSATDYIYIGIVVLGWAFTLRLIWFAIPLVRVPGR